MLTGHVRATADVPVAALEHLVEMELATGLPERLRGGVGNPAAAGGAP